MSQATGLKVRKSIDVLQEQYLKGEKKALEDLMRAWQGIKALPATHPNSFFMIGGYHGEPFRGAGWGNSSYWGGYCNHGNVLFPTWHRAYLVRLENALQSIPGCQDVMLPFWDEASDRSVSEGLPWALTQETFELDGKTIPNPLRSFVFNRGITDNINGDNPNYSKPVDYETRRYPLSGLVGTDADRARTEQHNEQFPDYAKNVSLLNQNIVNWLGTNIVVRGKVINTNVKDKYIKCLDAPNFTVFSNTTSAAEWNQNQPKGSKPVVPLESPHNSIHLAVGGFDVPGQGDYSPISGANGDMGENDTAGLDPIFYFHHCFIDRVFWLWQKKHGHTDHLALLEDYPGSNSVDSQGPTPGVVPNSWLTLDTPLDPFKVHENGKERAARSHDFINIERQLGYTYGPGSLDERVGPQLLAAEAEDGPNQKMLVVSGLNRAPISGSFLVSAYANIDGERYLIDTEAVLSRWSVKYCANCQTHLEVKAFFGLHRLPLQAAEAVNFEVEIHTRDGVLPQHAGPQALTAAVGGVAAIATKNFRVEVR